MPWASSHTVNTFWDIGPAHTRIWLAQSVGLEFRFIDYINLEIPEATLANAFKELKNERSYTYGDHYLPWDADNPEFISGRSVKEQLGTLFGADRVHIMRQTSLENQIAAARLIFAQSYFDREKCADGLKALRCYQYEYDKDLRTYSRKPLHDWASHGASAFQTAAVMIQGQKPKKSFAQGPPTRTGSTWG